MIASAIFGQLYFFSFNELTKLVEIHLPVLFYTGLMRQDERNLPADYIYPPCKYWLLFFVRKISLHLSYES